jgi:hypothetical protein
MDIADLGVVSSTLLWVVFWLFVAAVILVPKYLRSRERSKLLDTLKVAYEKGQPVPPELIDALQRGATTTPEQTSITTAESDLRRAIVLIAVGLGIALLGYGLYYGISYASEEGGAITGAAVAGAGAIPGIIGVAYLLLWLGRRQTSKS